MDSLLVSSGVATYFIAGAALLSIGFGIYNVNWVCALILTRTRSTPLILRMRSWGMR